MRRLHEVRGVLLMLTALATPLAAQFYTPLPKSLPADSVRADLARRDSARLGLAGTSPTTRKVAPLSVPLLKLRAPFAHDRAALIRYLAATGNSGSLALAQQFATNLSDSTAYVTTDIISGLLGRTLFGIQYARVLAKTDAGLPDTTRQASEDNTASVQRLINNGGSVSARFLVPMYAGGGVTAQRTLSLSGTVGFNGPIDDRDRLSLSGSLVSEGAFVFAIRAPNGDADLLADLVTTVRLGVAAMDGRILSTAGDRALGFVQVGVGLRQSGGLGLSVLYTRTNNRDQYRPYAPRFLVNFSAMR
ncbi:MAG: hypothetical protein MUE41_15985 [Gemmatimonadaceae bacterium]|jgi:hypothetical protein|nr:hypothetical protein [Gemmatimonadaceae bacterium]